MKKDWSKRKKTLVIIFAIIALFITVITQNLKFKQQHKEELENTPQLEILLNEGEEMDDSHLYPTRFEKNITLSMAESDGIPQEVKDSLGIKDKPSETETPSSTFKYSIFESWRFPQSDKKPGENVHILNPKESESILGNSPFVLNWEIDTQRNITVDVFFSENNGKRWHLIAQDLSNKTSQEITIPNIVSDDCLFRVHVWIGDIFYGYDISNSFKIIQKVEKNTVNEIKIPSFIQDGNTLVSEDAPTRYFKVDVDLSSYEHLIWQISRIDFPYDLITPLDEVPGLLVEGSLESNQKYFALDFESIIDSIQKGKNSSKNKGESFFLKTEKSPFNQQLKNLYVRVVALDSEKNIIGVSNSSFNIQYGTPFALKLQDTFSIKGFLKIARIPGFVGPKHFDEFPSEGVILYAGQRNQWEVFDNWDVGVDSKREIQIATSPFSTKFGSDLINPENLVYREFGYAKSLPFKVDFDDFAMKFKKTNSNVIETFYVRVIAYLDDGDSSISKVVTTKSETFHLVHDIKLYLKLKTIVPPPEPTVITVKATTPKVIVSHYVPMRFGKKNPDQYFEVTERIEALKMGFIYRNKETGVVIYPYTMHYNLIKKISIVKYQELLDEHLKVGTIFYYDPPSKSGVDKLLDEFKDLLSAIYKAVQNFYNGMAERVAKFIAERLSFLGEKWQNLVERAVETLINYGLAYVGLPPRLPDFEQLAKNSLDYALQYAVQEAGAKLGLSPEDIPDSLKKEITDEITKQFDEVISMKQVSLLNLPYLKPWKNAHTRYPYVYIYIDNPHDKWSDVGYIYINFTDHSGFHGSILESKIVPIPSIQPKSTLKLAVYLGRSYRYDWLDAYIGNTMYADNTTLDIVAQFNHESVEEAAKKQNLYLEGDEDVVYEFDRDPNFNLSIEALPKDPIGKPMEGETIYD